MALPRPQQPLRTAVIQHVQAITLFKQFAKKYEFANPVVRDWFGGDFSSAGLVSYTMNWTNRSPWGCSYVGNQWSDQVQVYDNNFSPSLSLLSMSASGGSGGVWSDNWGATSGNSGNHPFTSGKTLKLTVYLSGYGACWYGWAPVDASATIVTITDNYNPDRGSFILKGADLPSNCAASNNGGSNMSWSCSVDIVW